MDTRDLIRTLKGVPEAHLRILELCHKVIGKTGDVNPEKVAFYSAELVEATKEAEQYSKDTHEAVRCLRGIARS
jgi:hypothetical protein